MPGNRVGGHWRTIAVAVIALSRTALAADSAATATIRRLDEALLGVLQQANTLDYAGRYARLTPAVTTAFDYAFMAEKSLGQHWKTLDAPQRTRWLDLSLRFSIANYAANFDHWGGQTIDLLGEEPSANDTVVVHTRINDPKGETVEMNYRLRATDSGWKVVDIYLKGTVSELALRRADYTAVMDRDGFDGLVRTMEGKIVALAAGKAKR
ncbi:MAG: ABC transporter substrate-binding protein [Candidatus Binatia bacterium]